MKIRSDLVVRRGGSGGAQLFDRRSGGIFALNGSGDVLVAALERGATRAELCAALVERFDVTPLVARTDLDLFLERLAQHGLVER